MGAEQSRLPPRSPSENSSGERAEAWSRPDDFLGKPQLATDKIIATPNITERSITSLETPTLEDSSTASSELASPPDSFVGREHVLDDFEPEVVGEPSPPMKRPAEEEPARTPPLTSARRLAKKATDAIKARQLAIASVVQRASAHAEAPAAAPASDAAGAPPLSFSKSSAAKQPRSAAAAGDRSAPCKKWPTVTPASGQQQARPGSSGRVLARYDTVTKTLHGVARGDIVRGADPHVPIYQGITPREEEEVSNSHRPVEPNSPPSPPLEGSSSSSHRIIGGEETKEVLQSLTFREVEEEPEVEEEDEECDEVEVSDPEVLVQQQHVESLSA